MAEDILRRSGYLLPQGTGARSRSFEGLLADKHALRFSGWKPSGKLLVMMKKDDGIREEKTMKSGSAPSAVISTRGPIDGGFQVSALQTACESI
jgi:hypothetical protein